MHCDCCDKLLSDWETSLRLVSTGDFANTCWKCLEGLNIPVKGNPLLKRKKDEIVEERDEDVESFIPKQTFDYNDDEE